MTDNECCSIVYEYDTVVYVRTTPDIFSHTSENYGIVALSVSTLQTKELLLLSKLMFG